MIAYEDGLGLILKSMTRLKDCCVASTLLRTDDISLVLVKSDECICEKMSVHLVADFSRYGQKVACTVARSFCHCIISLGDVNA